MVGAAQQVECAALSARGETTGNREMADTTETSETTEMADVSATSGGWEEPTGMIAPLISEISERSE